MWPLQLLSTFFDVTLKPFQSLSPIWALSVWAVLTGLVMLLIIRAVSNQPRIKETKNKIKAHILELWLFKDDMRVMLAAQRHILRLNGRYLTLTLKPMLIMVVPMVLMLLSFEGWFGYQPLQSGEEAIVSVQVADTAPDLLDQLALTANNGINVETPPLRIPSSHEVNWRIRANSPGVHQITLALPDQQAEKQVIVSRELTRVSPGRFRSGWWQALVSPGEPPLVQQLGIQHIEIDYPERSIQVWNWEIHWLVYFFLVSILFAFTFKSVFRVEL